MPCLIRLRLLFALCLALLASPAAAQKIVTVDVKGAARTVLLAINKANAAAGQWARQEGYAHCFLRDSHGTIVKFDPDPLGSHFCAANGIDDDGNVGGYFLSHSRHNLGFIRYAAGNITTFDAGLGLDGTFTHAMDKGDVAGWTMHCQPQCHDTGFVRKASGRIQSFSVVSGYTTDGTGIRDGWITGNYIDQNGFAGNGFVRDPRGQFTTFQVPGSVTNNSGKINNSQTVAGTVTLQSALFNGFVRTSDGTITVIDLTNGADSTVANGINDHGVVVGWYRKDGIEYGYLRSPEGAITTFTARKAVETVPVAINDAGWIAGSWTDKAKIIHGFIRTP